MGHYLCIGDQICLYCEETSGYVFNVQSSTTHNNVFVYGNQSRDKPKEIPNPLAVTFEVCVKNRYKFDKMYRNLRDKVDTSGGNLALQAKFVEAKLAAESEKTDNDAEQGRQKGRRLRYGQIIQLKHLFTNKYIHVSTTTTSLRDKNYMMVSLHEYNAKQTQFKILPRYKVKSEGDIVQIDDQIVLESVKSAGQFLHCSAPFQIDKWTKGSELNLGGSRAGFTIIKYHSPKKEEKFMVKGGSVLRLFHKEIEAYLTADGVFNNKETETIHLRVRTIDSSKPKSVFPSTSAITYWQIESEEKLLAGDVIRWQQQVRLRHMATRRYLSVGSNGQLDLEVDSHKPNTVFRLHAVVQDKDEIDFEMYCRIEHVLTGRWIHAHKDEEYIRQTQDAGRTGLKWDFAQLRKVSAITECMYDDAFTVQFVNAESVENFNYVSGMVPFILNLLQQVTDGRDIPTKVGFMAVNALKEIKQFVVINGQPSKDRQKLLRNLKVIDLLVRYLKLNVSSSSSNARLAERIVLEAYDVIEAYLLGDSRKNELYFAKYIDYFNTQFNAKGDIGLRATQMLTELVKDNQKIVDRVTEADIQTMVTLVKRKRNYRYLDYLGMLCVCNGTSMSTNQKLITRMWLVNDKQGIYLTELGEKVNQKRGSMFVSTNNGHQWAPLHDFAVDDKTEDYLFLEHQLELFVKLCHGRNSYAVNVITKELGYLTWDEAFTCLKEKLLPPALRAHYCHVIIGMFVDVGSNRSVLDQMKLSFVFEEIGQSDPFQKYLRDMPKDIQDIFPDLRDWIMMFLDQNKDMTASEIGQNMLIEQVLKLLGYLVRYGYYTEEKDIEKLLPPLLSLLDGRNDKPFILKKGESREANKMVNRYRSTDRFQKSPETQAVVNAKYQAMEVVELLMDMTFQVRLDKLIAIFKGVMSKGKSKLTPMIDTTSDLLSNHGLMKKANSLLEDIFVETRIFDHEQITEVLLDLSEYDYDIMVRMSMKLLIKFNSVRVDLFDKAVQAQVLITPESEQVHRQIAHELPVIKMLANAKLTEAQTQHVQNTMEMFIRMCHLQNEPDERHAMNQNILVNHGVLDVLFRILSHRIDLDMEDQYEGMRRVMQTSLKLLRYLGRGNQHVQMHMFDHLDFLLAIKGVDVELALACTEIFNGNQTTCLKVQSRQIQKIVQLAAEHLEKAPEYLDLLCAIVKVEELNLPLKRNQDYVMKHVMQQYNKLANILDKSHEERIKILQGVNTEAGQQNLSYLISLVDLFATCAEGENRLIESLCQTIFSVDELVAVLDDRSINNNLKRPFLRFLLWVYLNTASNILESGVIDLPSQICTWFRELSSELVLINKYVEHNAEAVKLLLKKSPPKSHVPDTAEGRAYGTLHFLFDAAFPFIQVFFEKKFDYSREPQMRDIIDKLANTLVQVSERLTDLISDSNQMVTMVQCVNSILLASELSPDIIASYVNSHKELGEVQAILSDVQEQYHHTYREEQKLNVVLNIFATNYSIVYRGQNTVRSQIGYGSDLPYSDVGSDNEIPLGKEFQKLVSSFRSHSTRPLQKCSKLILQLWISSHNISLIERNSKEQVQLDLRCLQIMRALIHNEMVKLSPEWEEKIEASTPQLEAIEGVQDELNAYGAVLKTLSLVERQNDSIVKEYLSFLAIMLFNANVKTQYALESYCLKTRDEMFFNTVQEKIHISINTTKERRFLSAQFESRKKDAEARAQTLRQTLGKSGHTIQNGIQKESSAIKKEELGYEDVEQAHLRSLQIRAQSSMANNASNKSSKKKKGIKFKDDNDKKPVGIIQQQDEGHVELLMKVLAGMCDGQNQVLQNYLREQPDNIKSTNLVAETITFLSHIYSNITESSITLVIQIFDSLIEFTSGNTANQHVVYDNNIIDYINFILRSDKYNGSPPEQILDLKDCIGKLLGLMIHENKSEASTLLVEIRDTIDFESVHRVATQCFITSKASSTELAMKEKYVEVGFIYHFLLQRIIDISPGKSLEGTCKTQDQHQAARFYRRNSKSIEIVKDDTVQKVRFRIRDQKVLRDEVKEMLKWDVDRSSSSNKIRGLMEWSKDIIEDIYYQRRVRSHRILAFFIVFWSFFNKATVLLSVAINAVMLATWESQGSLGQPVIDDVIEATNDVPDVVYKPKPDPRGGDWYFLFIIILGVVHNIFSLCVLISYFISNRPKLPTWRMFTNKSRSVIGIRRRRAAIDKTGGEEEVEKIDQEDVIVKKQRMLNITQTIRGKKGADNGRDFDSQLREEFISFTTLYYVMFFLISIAGTATYGYFFAFHLLNIVYNNQILQRVTQAVTQNGKSLLWVTLLGLIVIYIFALVAFAGLRENMDPNGEQALYCHNLAQCTVSMIRFGLIGDLFEFMRPAEYRNFHTFGITTIFHLMFFIIITTIGLNIIFGIILDTFSELRQLKFAAENDMRSLCFICNRGSYEFESHGQGFEVHVDHEHNMWSYIFFFIHLDSTKPNDYTNIEQYVAGMIQEGRFDFFPVGKALALSSKDEDLTETKLDEITKNVEILLKAHQQGLIDRDKKQEQERQKKWEAQHREAFASEAADL